MVERVRLLTRRKVEQFFDSGALFRRPVLQNLWPSCTFHCLCELSSRSRVSVRRSGFHSSVFTNQHDSTFVARPRVPSDNGDITNFMSRRESETMAGFQLCLKSISCRSWPEDFPDDEVAYMRLRIQFLPGLKTTQSPWPVPRRRGS